MNLLKRNIKIAIGVIGVMLIILMIFQFAPEAWVQSVFSRCGIICASEFAENFAEFVISITSGVLGSTIVALVFYINEYSSEKRKLIYEIIRESNRFQEIYIKIPYLVNGGDYYSLERDFYYEVLENRENQKKLML